MKKIPVKEYTVSFSAVFNITIGLMAESEEDAIELAKQGHGNMLDESWSYIHPDTEFFVEEVP